MYTLGTVLSRRVQEVSVETLYHDISLGTMSKGISSSLTMTVKNINLW
jgi:hypothetical protein